MAIVTLGPMATAVSGSIGGTVFSHNRGGTYIRARAIPVTSTTPEALAAKSRLSAGSSAWQGLTPGQRQAWLFWATANPVTNTLGKSILLTGQQALVGLYTRLDLAGQATLTTPPIVPAPTALESLVQDGDIGAGDTDATFAPTPRAVNQALWIQAAVTNSAGINYVKNLLKFCGVSAAAESSPFDDQALIEARVGTLAVGQTLHVFISVFDFTTGLLSGPIRDSIIITTS